MKIELIKPGVANKVIIASTLNDGSHPWLIPAAQTPGNDYKVKITSTINVSNNDTSDNGFTIPDSIDHRCFSKWSEKTGHEEQPKPLDGILLRVPERM